MFNFLGLSYDTNEPVLKDAFKQYGELMEGIFTFSNQFFLLCVIFIWSITITNSQYLFFEQTVKVICDHLSGKSKGYGFVNYALEISASNALKVMDGKVKFEIRNCCHFPLTQTNDLQILISLILCF